MSSLLPTVLFSCRSGVLPGLSYQSGRSLLCCTSSSLYYFSHRSHMQPIKCMFGVCYFMVSEKHSTHQLGSESGDAVEDQRFCSNCPVRHYCSTMISLLLKPSQYFLQLNIISSSVFSEQTTALKKYFLNQI